MYVIGLMGCWLLADAAYSINVYMDSDNYAGKKQTWRSDHWVRVVRGLIGLALMVIGSIGDGRPF